MSHAELRGSGASQTERFLFARYLTNPPDVTHELTRLTVTEPVDLCPGELREIDWPEDGVRDYRLQLPGVEGRKLAIQVSGDPAGYPIFLLHGMPNGRIQLMPSAEELSDYGFRVFSYDRPGYGCSDRHMDRTVADVVPDIKAIASAFGLDIFSIVGRSGGSPGALACAALFENLPGGPQLERVVASVSSAPQDAEGLDLYEGLGPANTADARLKPAELIVKLTERANAICQDPWALLKHLAPDLRSDDYLLINDHRFLIRLIASHALAVANGPYGLIDDALALRKPWGFDPRVGTRVPVHLWAGTDDPFTPVGHTRWLADHIPGARATIEDGRSHFRAMDLMPILDACFGDVSEARARALGRSVSRLIPTSVFSNNRT